jgi:hypothetical protein
MTSANETRAETGITKQGGLQGASLATFRGKKFATKLSVTLPDPRCRKMSQNQQASK